MSDRYTSRVFVAGLALYDRLSEATFPAHPTTSKSPAVTFGDENPDKGADKICVVLDVEQTEAAWARLGAPGRDEPMVFNIVIRTWTPIPNATTRDVWLRLAALSEVVEGVVYDADTRRVRPLGFDGEVPIGRVSGVKPTVFPDTEGWRGGAVVTVTLQAEI